MTSCVYDFVCVTYNKKGLSDDVRLYTDCSKFTLTPVCNISLFFRACVLHSRLAAVDTPTEKRPTTTHVCRKTGIGAHRYLHYPILDDP